MRKQSLFIIAAICIFAFAGCKKKETIDLASLHTTAAVSKEALPIQEETRQSSAEQTEAPTEQANSDSKYSLKTEIRSYNIGNTTVEYPEVSNMKDAEKEKQVNELLRHNALGVIDALKITESALPVTVKATIESANLKRIVVSYTSSSPRIFYTNTIDLDAVKNLRLSDYTDAYTAAGYVASGDYKLESTSGADETAIREYISQSGRNTDYYYKKLADADFSGGYSDTMAVTKFSADTWPELFSYEKQGVVYFSLPVSAELGDYVIVRYSPDNK